MSKNTGIRGLCGVSFHMKVIPSSELFGIIEFLLYSPISSLPINPSICTNLSDRFIIMPAEILHQSEMLHLFWLHAQLCVLQTCPFRNTSSKVINYVTKPIGLQPVYVVETYSEWRQEKGSDHNKSKKGWMHNYVVHARTEVHIHRPCLRWRKHGDSAELSCSLLFLGQTASVTTRPLTPLTCWRKALYLRTTSAL